MKIALVQLNYHIGNFSSNAQKIIEHIKTAKANGAQLAVFSELSICGYSPLDMLEQTDFIEQCNHALLQIAQQCSGIAAIVGAPTPNNQPRGKNLFNSACLLVNGKIEQVINKSLLPTYDIFDEYRYFEPGQNQNIIELNGERFAITICEDIWDNQPITCISARGQLYKKCPLEQLSNQNPQYIINIAASPYSYNQGKIRKQVLIDNTKRFNLPIIYVNQTGANTDLIFDGDSMVIDANGNTVLQLAKFADDVKYIDSQQLINKQYKTIDNSNSNYIAEIHDALVLGIADYFKKMNFKTATLGLSGGIDSAVVLVLAARAIGAQNIQVLLLPSKYSSNHSVTDAVKLAENLGVKYHNVSIQPTFDAFEQSLAPVFTGTKPDVTEENIQARVRGTMLMALSNKFGNILLNTSNKSEAAVGYGTLYGDMNGGLSVIGDVYKTDVYKLAKYINKNNEVIPVNTIIKPPSAELRPDQKDSDSLPEYDILDAILFQYIEQKLSAPEIIAQGFNPDVVLKVLRLVNINEYKRFQSPPILRVSSKAFGFGRRIPLVAAH